VERVGEWSKEGLNRSLKRGLVRSGRVGWNR